MDASGLKRGGFRFLRTVLVAVVCVLAAFAFVVWWAGGPDDDADAINLRRGVIEAERYGDPSQRP